MTLHVGMAVDTEFLRLVLRQLIRRLPGVELAGEAETPSGAVALPRIDTVVVDVAACRADPQGFAAMCRRFPGRIVMIGDGAAVDRAGMIVPPAMILVPMGTATAARDLSLLATRLEEAFRPLIATAPVPPVAVARRTPVPEPVREPDVPAPRRAGRARRPELIVVAASTGGPEALQELLGSLGRAVCPIVIALHIPAEHCDGLARHLAASSGQFVTVGEAGPLPAEGVVLLRGGLDYRIVERNEGLCLRIVPLSDSVFHPNGDVLLCSGAVLDRAVVGVVLTGMGNDGCAGAVALAARGYPVLVQTPASCAVPGMPGAAIAAGAVSEIAAPAGIAARLNSWFALPFSG
jgi:two-component system chemotaxis response regulator CheB